MTRREVIASSNESAALTGNAAASSEAADPTHGFKASIDSIANGSSFIDTFTSLEKMLEETLTGDKWKDLQATSKVAKAKCGARWLKEIDGPDMWLIESTTIMKLGYIPRHDEARNNGYIYTLEDAVEKWAADGEKGPLDEINFLSHNWCMGPEHSRIDDHEHSKAKAVARWHRWRNAAYKRSRGNDTPVLWWIDWSCIDQTNTAPGAAMLPAYIKLCGMCLCFVHDEEGRYFTRGWCRIERCLFTAMNSPRNWLYHLYPPAKFNAWQKIDDPREGQLTKPSDMEFISKLTEIALRYWKINRENNFDGTNDYMSSPWKEAITPELLFGKTPIMSWEMSQHMGSA